MLDFSTRYPCPTRLISGGGTGPYGLCAMELLAVMLGAVDGHGRVVDHHPDIHPDLADLVISANDFGFGYISTEQRTTGLWPVLPKVIGTAGAPFPWIRYRELLGMAKENGYVWSSDSYPYSIRRWAWEQAEKDGANADRAEDYAKAWPYALDALKVAINLHAETNSLDLQEDFTSEQMSRLYAYLEGQESPHLKPLEAIAA